MYRIQLRFSNRKMFYGEPFSELKESYPIIAQLEDEWRQWQLWGSPQLSPDKAVQFLESSEIYVIEESGRMYHLNDRDEFEIMN